MREAVLDQRNLGAQRIDGVDQRIQGQRPEQRRDALFIHILPHARHVQRRIDVQQTLPHHLALAASDSRMQRRKLAVDITDGNRIHVHKHDVTDACADKHLGRHGAHAAEAYDRNAGVSQASEGIGAKKQPSPFLPGFHQCIQRSSQSKKVRCQKSAF